MKMFEHSVKVPRHYKIAANILKKVSTQGGSVKSLLYDDKLRHFRINVLFALITETIKHAASIDKMFEDCGIFNKEPRLDQWLAKILTAELLFGKKSLPGKSKPEQTISSYKDQFEKYIGTEEDILKTKVVRRPRYVRINTNMLTTSDAIGIFQDEGYRFVRCTSSSYDDYLNQIRNLQEYDFTQDYHIKTVFVFSSGTKLHEHELYLESKIILQDKATALAVHLLAPPQGSVVLDMCAAPGMKTTQLAACLRNVGKIYAVERNEKRYQILCDLVSKTESKCVETIHKDALEIKRGDYDDVEYVLLDPSCSGSGMELCVHNYIDPSRLAKLTSLQEKFLKHAMNAFPKAKRIVYSTCSLFPEENERVITNVVKTSRAKWRVQDVKELLKGQWNNIGSGMYGSMGMRCIYARPDTDLTTGFFLAVLDRDQKNIGKNDNIDKDYDEKKEIKFKSTNDDTTVTKGQENYEENVPRKKKKKEGTISGVIHSRKNSETKKNETEYSVSHEDENNVKEHNALRKKKKKKKNSEIVNTDNEMKLNVDATNYTESNENKQNIEVQSVSRKKKKKDKNIKVVDNDKHLKLIDTIINEEEQPKKKKRKLDKETVIEPEDRENNLKSKKKKRTEKEDPSKVQDEAEKAKRKKNITSVQS